MLRHFRFSLVCLAIIFGSQRGAAQAPATPPKAKPDYSVEAFVIEQDSTRIDFENDGTYKRQSSARVRIQSGAGVQRYSVLSFPYQNLTETNTLTLWTGSPKGIFPMVARPLQRITTRRPRLRLQPRGY